jgi:hypothetical protein
MVEDSLSRGQRAGGKGQGAVGSGQWAESREQRAESREQRAGSTQPVGSAVRAPKSWPTMATRDVAASGSDTAVNLIKNERKMRNELRGERSGSRVR